MGRVAAPKRTRSMTQPRVCQAALWSRRTRLSSGAACAGGAQHYQTPSRPLGAPRGLQGVDRPIFCQPIESAPFETRPAFPAEGALGSARAHWHTQGLLEAPRADLGRVRPTLGPVGRPQTAKPPPRLRWRSPSSCNHCTVCLPWTTPTWCPASCFKAWSESSTRRGLGMSPSSSPAAL